MRVSGPFEILSKRSLLRHTGHSRQHAFPVMVVMPMMDVQQLHLYFRLGFAHREVNSTRAARGPFAQMKAPKVTHLTRPAHSRTLSQ
jgi:hypothetical protein